MQPKGEAAVAAGRKEVRAVPRAVAAAAVASRPTADDTAATVVPVAVITAPAKRRDVVAVDEAVVLPVYERLEDQHWVVVGGRGGRSQVACVVLRRDRGVGVRHLEPPPPPEKLDEPRKGPALPPGPVFPPVVAAVNDHRNEIHRAGKGPPKVRVVHRSVGAQRFLVHTAEDVLHLVRRKGRGQPLGGAGAVRSKLKRWGLRAAVVVVVVAPELPWAPQHPARPYISTVYVVID